MSHPQTHLLDRALVALIQNAFPFTAPPPAPNYGLDWTGLEERARYHGLTPLLATSLEAQPRIDVPEEMRQALADSHKSSALAGATKFHELDRVLALTRAEKIPLLLLKGAALARWLYPQPSLRPFGDVDILIHQTDVPRLQACLAARAYQPGQELAGGFSDAFYSELALQQTAPPRLALDVHWHLFVPLYFRRHMNVAWFWERTLEYTHGDSAALLLHPTAQLVHLTVHASLNHRHTPRLLWLYDLALLFAKHGGEIDWDDAARLARTSQVTRSVYDILAQVQEWWGVAAPAPFMETLRNTRVGLDEKIAFALTAAPHNQARVLSDALAAPGMQNKFQYAARHLLPDAAYMQTHYRIHHRALLPIYYARRLCESGWKFARSLLSTLTRK